MQEPKDDKDEEYCKKINDFLNNPPAPGSKSTSGLPHGLSSLGDQLGTKFIFAILNMFQMLSTVSNINYVG